MEKLEIDKTIKQLVKQKEEAIKEKTPDWLHRSKNGELSVYIPLLAQDVLNRYNFLIVEHEAKDILHIYKKDFGCWFRVSKDKIKSIVAPMLVKYGVWTANKENDASKLIYSSIKRVTYANSIGNINARYTNFINGVWDWQNMELIPHSPNYYFTSVINIKLDPDNKTGCPETEKWLKLSLDENYLPMMEYIGYSLYRSYKPIQAFVILHSPGGDGKTTFLNHIQKIIGGANISNVSLKDLSSDRENNFKLSELIGKYLNIYDDISKDIIKDISVIKVISGGGAINASVKGMPDTRFFPYAKLLFACNTLPEFRNTEPAFERRINVFEFYRIEDFKNVIDMNKVNEEIPFFVFQCMKLAKKAFNHPDHLLTQTPSAIKARQSWLYDNDITAQFIDELCYIDPETSVNLIDLYQTYINWCKENGKHPLSRNKFAKDLKNKGYVVEQKRLRIKSDNGPDKRKRIYICYSLGLTIDGEKMAVGENNPVVNCSGYKFNL